MVFLVLFSDSLLVLLVVFQRSPSASVPKLPTGWSSVSSPTARSLPFNLLSSSELQFLDMILQRPLFSKDDFSFLLHECFGDFLGNLSNDSLFNHLYSGECYADREYYSPTGSLRGSIRIFRLGLVSAYPMPKLGVRFEHWFGYPTCSPYRLVPSKFRRPFPHHDVFSNWCFRELQQGLTEDEITTTDSSRRKIPHWHGKGDYIADNCHRVLVNNKKEYIWFEVHTGAEGYDEDVFITRLLSAENHLKGKGRFVVIVPFKRDLDKARRGIQKYNLKAEVDENKPILELEVSEIISYHGIKNFKEKLGYYEHASRV